MKIFAAILLTIVTGLLALIGIAIENGEKKETAKLSFFELPRYIVNGAVSSFKTVVGLRALFARKAAQPAA